MIAAYEFSVGNASEAFAICDRLIARFASSENAQVLNLIADMLGVKGDWLFQKGRVIEALAVYNDIIFRWSDFDDLRKVVITSLKRKLECLYKLGRYGEAVATCDELSLQVAADSDDITQGEMVKYFWLLKFGEIEAAEAIKESFQNHVQYDGSKIQRKSVKEDIVKRIEKTKRLKMIEEEISKEPELAEIVVQLIERVKQRPDLALACLKFLDEEVTRPAYAILSAELTEARLDKQRIREREKKARYRKRRAEGKAEPI